MIILGGFFAVFGIALIVMGRYGQAKGSPYKNGIQVTGQVVGSKTAQVDGTGPDSLPGRRYWPIVKFVDNEGTEHQVQAVVGQINEPAPGRPMRVSYLAGAPDRAHVLNSWAGIVMGPMFMALGAFMVIGSTVFTVALLAS